MQTRRPQLVRTLAVLAALVLVALGGLALLGGLSDGCDGQSHRLSALQQIDAFRTVPDGSRPTSAPEPGAECVDDSGDAMLYASQDYPYTGTPAQVTDFYLAALPKLGWGAQPSPRAGETCFTRETDAGWTVLRIRFADANLQDQAYRLFAEAAVDGRTTCSD
ncbi:hypothetical protein OG689_37500 [Kitasatospora sp. NBC_00240]|uniref:hypothetical protein n=1 Tax=Kitasatospora sp. NBC_00240 TaxID=2903567 RepID=UPI0022533997|nr:hypothetical protein [Kitasatospora sp. NBC_00240]MCX5214892.1 hypothetical protein [Kitasatospora sp. NBC_00240]